MGKTTLWERLSNQKSRVVVVNDEVATEIKDRLLGALTESQRAEIHASPEVLHNLWRSCSTITG